MALEEKASGAAPWDSLPPDLIHRVAGLLLPNEVPCSLRLLCRSWASAFSGAQHKTIRLSKWAHHEAYAARWGAPGAVGKLTRDRREQLMRLTASSGSVQNLELAAALPGCTLSEDVSQAAAGAGQLDVLRWLQDRDWDVLHSWVLDAAAAGGHLDVCVWLRDQGCYFAKWTLAKGAQTGSEDLCDWLLANGCPWDDGAMHTAAGGGHDALLNFLLLERSRDDDVDERALLEAAAKGFPLPALQSMHREWAKEPGGWLEQLQQQEGGEGKLGQVVAAAAASSTPCWQAKVKWLHEVKDYPLTHQAFEEVTRCCSSDEEALARLTWLRGRGGEVGGGALAQAASNGLATSLEYLLAEGGSALWTQLTQTIRERTVKAAAGRGHLACLQVLHGAGVEVFPPESLLHAARCGQLPVVRWLVETPGVGAQLTVKVAAAAGAARSGGLELLSYLHERGCPWDVETWNDAVREGSEELLEWLRERGCPTKG